MKTKAILEVVVVFSLTLFLVALAGLSPIGEWVRQVTRRAFFEYFVMIVTPLIILLLSRRNLASFGISLRNIRYHLDMTLAAFVPMAVAISFSGVVNYQLWWGALIMAGLQIALLFILGRLLKRKPTRNESGIVITAVLLTTYSGANGEVTIGNAVSALIFYVFFLGLGEELLFRGYIQSRLNESFGKPFQFFGVSWGWGIIITSFLFGLMHLINLGSLIDGNWQLTPWWGFWTFFAGLVNGFLREKTGSIVAPTILHGLPQGIAYAILGR